MPIQEHGVIKFAFILFYAVVFIIILYKVLMGYAVKHECTIDKNPIFADVLRGLIAMVTGIDIALAAWLIAEAVR